MTRRWVPALLIVLLVLPTACSSEPTVERATTSRHAAVSAVSAVATQTAMAARDCKRDDASWEASECAGCHSPSSWETTTAARLCAQVKPTDNFNGCIDCHGQATYYKPVIYLYPPRRTAVQVRLDIEATSAVVDPAFADGSTWRVLADPSGRLVDLPTGRDHPYLFWEADLPCRYDMSSGTVVAGAESRRFLQDTLPRLGLDAAESKEFIAFWAPRLERSAFNLVRFEGPAYESIARLHVSPEPDTRIRVFMVYRPLDKWIEVEPQTLPQARRRDGFVLVEWGGTEMPSR